jgi:hypothetical protein
MLLTEWRAIFGLAPGAHPLFAQSSLSRDTTLRCQREMGRFSTVGTAAKPLSNGASRS